MPAQSGAKHHNAKLDARKVRQARKTYEAGKKTIAALAQKYEVAPQTMWAAVHGRTWKGVQ